MMSLSVAADCWQLDESVRVVFPPCWPHVMSPTTPEQSFMREFNMPTCSKQFSPSLMPTVLPLHSKRPYACVVTVDDCEVVADVDTDDDMLEVNEEVSVLVPVEVNELDTVWLTVVLAETLAVVDMVALGVDDGLAETEDDNDVLAVLEAVVVWVED